MAIAFRSAANAGTSTASTSLTITKPAGAVAGDLLFAAVQCGPESSRGVQNAPAGWKEAGPRVARQVGARADGDADHRERVRATERGAAGGALAADALGELRNIIFGLRPSILDDLGLVPAIRWYARTNLEPFGINVVIEVPQEDLHIPEELSTMLFRISAGGHQQHPPPF